MMRHIFKKDWTWRIQQFILAAVILAVTIIVVVIYAWVTGLIYLEI